MDQKHGWQSSAPLKVENYPAELPELKKDARYTDVSADK